MARRVIVSAPARRDLTEIGRWYSQPGSGERAKQRLRRITGAMRQLASDALAWPTTDLGTRERNVERHTIVCRVSDDDVEILRVFGPGQDRRV